MKGTPLGHDPLRLLTVLLARLTFRHPIRLLHFFEHGRKVAGRFFQRGESRRGLQGVHLTHSIFNGRQVGRRQFTEVLADARLVYGAQLMTQSDR